MSSAAVVIGALKVKVMLFWYQRHTKVYSSFLVLTIYNVCDEGWSGGAKVLGKLPVPGRPTNLDYSRARAYCACSRCG